MSKGSVGRWLAVAAGVVVVATVVAAIVVMGSPSAQRTAKLDDRRVRDLDRIVDVIGHYVEREHSLPPDLATLAREPGRRLAIVDPVDGSPYGYEITGARTFRLCAVFATDTAKSPEGSERRRGDAWNHGTGRQCFDRKIKGRSNDGEVK
jgi:hypothetical protein